MIEAVSNGKRKVLVLNIYIVFIQLINPIGSIHIYNKNIWGHGRNLHHTRRPFIRVFRIFNFKLHGKKGDVLVVVTRVVSTYYLDK